MLKILKKLITIGLFFMTSLIHAKPFFGVDLDLVNIGVEIKVNDIPIYYDEKSGQLTVELPCPDSIINGQNELSVKAFLPVNGDTIDESFTLGAYVVAKLFIQGEDEKKTYLSSIKITPNREGKLELTKENTLSKKTPKITYLTNNSAEFTVFAEIDSPFPSWAWQKGMTITNQNTEIDSLYKTYEDLHQALSENNQKLLKELYDHKAKEIAEAYYLTNKDAGHEKINTGKDALNSNLRLLKLIEIDRLELEIMANGKMARLVTANGTQPIAYGQMQPRLLHMHKFMFYKNNKNQWIMIR